MTKGMALTIGLNSVNPERYGGWDGQLVACEADATDMAEIARSAGFDVTTLLTQAATRDHVIAELERAARVLADNDIFMLSYSGHGGQLPDKNSDEDDALDETWCLYDAELVDDEIYRQLGKFAKGVRIVVFSDSCHSGTVTKDTYYRSIRTTPRGDTEPVRYRFMPPEVAQRVYRENRQFYDAILEDPALKEARGAIQASVLLISGCQDNQYSADGPFNGLFTSRLLTVWNNGKFKGSYTQFHALVLRQMPPDQSPNYFRVGRTNAAFERQRPFRV